MTFLPGDAVLRDADPVMDRHLHLDAPPATVWPWVEQLGKGRAGWYLPRSVERLVPTRRRALRFVDPGLLGLQVGDSIPDWGPGDPTFEVLEIEPPRHLVFWSERPRRDPDRPPMRLTWALVLSPDGPAGDPQAGTHLHLRLRLDLGKPAGPLATYGGGAMDLATVWLLGRGLAERVGGSR